MYGGVQATTRKICKTISIPIIRRFAKAVINKCNLSKIYPKKSLKLQRTSKLPEVCTQKTKQFLTTGADFANRISNKRKSVKYTK